jgi:hypothetical protein
VASPQRLVQGCLDQLGAIEVSEPTRAVLLAHAENLDPESGDHKHAVAEMLRLVASTPEFQKG